MIIYNSRLAKCLLDKKTFFYEFWVLRYPLSAIRILGGNGKPDSCKAIHGILFACIVISSRSIAMSEAIIIKMG